MSEHPQQTDGPPTEVVEVLDAAPADPSTEGTTSPEGSGSQARADDGTGPERSERSSGRPSGGSSQLDQEGDAAADYLEELLDIADLDGDIDIFEENGRASVAVVADGEDLDGLAVLVGPDGAVLDALQELTRLAAQARTGERSRLLLDIGGWREARRETAARIAVEAIAKARATGATVDLDPMPAYQRKAVHDAVAAAGMRSESDGVEPSRYVVVHPS